VDPQLIIVHCCKPCRKESKELDVSIEGKSIEEKKCLLEKSTSITLNSKLIGREEDFFKDGG